MPTVHVNSLSVGRRIARDSDALFPATAEMLAPDVAAGNLVMLDFQLPAMKTEYGVITLAERSLAPATVAFVDHLRIVESEIAAREATTSAARKSTIKRSSRRAARASA